MKANIQISLIKLNLNFFWWIILVRIADSNRKNNQIVFLLLRFVQGIMSRFYNSVS